MCSKTYVSPVCSCCFSVLVACTCLQWCLCHCACSGCTAASPRGRCTAVSCLLLRHLYGLPSPPSQAPELPSPPQAPESSTPLALAADHLTLINQPSGSPPAVTITSSGIGWSGIWGVPGGAHNGGLPPHCVWGHARRGPLPPGTAWPPLRHAASWRLAGWRLDSWRLDRGSGGLREGFRGVCRLLASLVKHRPK